MGNVANLKIIDVKPKIKAKTLDKEKNKISIEEKIRNIKNFSIIKL